METLSKCVREVFSPSLFHSRPQQVRACDGAERVTERAMCDSDRWVLISFANREMENFDICQNVIEKFFRIHFFTSRLK